MAINRSTFSSTIPAEAQPSIAKVIVANITPKGYLHVTTVRTQIVDSKPVEVFMDVLVHPDRACNANVQLFDAVSISGISGRQAPGEPRTNTDYVWASGISAIGKHLVEKQADGTLKNMGVGIFAIAE